MFKYVLAFVALFAAVMAAPEPKPQYILPAATTYSSGIVRSAAYPAVTSYTAGTYPTAYSAYAPSAYSAYSAYPYAAYPYAYNYY